jgi:hypothetical protein
MRGGPFSETRVIELLNRRFVSFYYNTGGPGLGKDAEAAAFINGKVPNRWAFFAAFAPDGSVLGVTEVYAGTNDVFDFLAALLRAYPECDRETAEETAALARANKGDASAKVAAGALCEQLVRYGDARSAYAAALAGGEAEQVAAYRGLLRVARYERDWPDHERWLQAAGKSSAKPQLAVDLVLEAGYRLMAQKRWAHARALLQPATRTALASNRLAELHYEAGRACWLMGDHEWAKLHWSWIIEHLPDDRFYMRASLAAAAEVFPYPNQELGGYQASVGPVGPGIIGQGVAAARAVYRRLLPRFEAGDFGQTAVADEPEVALMKESHDISRVLDLPESLAARLRDNGDAAGNARTVEKIMALGEAAVMPLIVAGNNPAFLGRGQVATALAAVMVKFPAMAAETKKAAMATLQLLAKDRDGAIAKNAKAALQSLKPAPPDSGDAGKGEPATELPKSPTLLVALLRDGNDHRVADNRIVDALVSVGEPALAPLRTALEDKEFRGRGYAAFALGSVLRKLGTRPPELLELLTAAAADQDPYVRALAKSARGLLD